MRNPYEKGQFVLEELINASPKTAGHRSQFFVSEFYRYKYMILSMKLMDQVKLDGLKDSKWTVSESGRSLKWTLQRDETGRSSEPIEPSTLDLTQTYKFYT